MRDLVVVVGWPPRRGNKNRDVLEAVILAKAGQTRDARVLLTRLVSTHPHRLDLMWAVAGVYEEVLGDYKLAEKALRAYVNQLEPPQPGPSLPVHGPALGAPLVRGVRSEHRARSEANAAARQGCEARALDDLAHAVTRVELWAPGCQAMAAEVDLVLVQARLVLDAEDGDP